MSKLDNAFEKFDSYNKEDPNKLVWNDIEYPAEYFYAIALYNWVRKLEPAASEALQLASRSQHIGRWKIPRASFPRNKAGYLNWRTTLARFHAETAGELMKEVDYDEETISTVKHIILKQNIKTDHEVQVMENALCLVFLEFQYKDFLSNHDEEKVIRIIRKSWNKMSQPGRDAALKLDYDIKGKALLESALSS
jgi:Domain of unknown function (DUF4202)